MIGDNPFLSSINLKYIIIKENSQHFKYENNILTTKNGSELITYAIGDEATCFFIPFSVRITRTYSFSFSKISSIVFSVSSFGTSPLIRICLHI